jgi:predicted enzyme related to lactoylglutathione lyase
MAKIEEHAPGSFCWIELATTDQNAAKQFYTSLFGWSVADMPMGPDNFYSMFKVDGRDSGAACTMQPEMRAQGIPPHWGLYIATANVDETAAKAASAGGTVVEAPFDVFDVGRMTVIRDPTGAVFFAFQANRHEGIGIAEVPGTLCWADLNTRDPEAASKFYTSVFGWDIKPGQDATGYLHIMNGTNAIGGIPPAEYLPPNVPPHWMLYFYVTDCDASTAKVKELGGAVCMGPMAIEKVGRMSVVTDPQGAAFALFTPK